ncbi:shufflon system plasmid conjugative transfer pilus tip adhesin PilV, partial [Pseudomonas oryzihabitans]|nr:shufflon system plasmid conjugative transfer pilus tip adhesin PilV [Pseudomonas oryzihabitans]
RRNGGSSPTCAAYNIPGYSADDVTTYSCPAGYTKTGWDTTGSGWRGASKPGLVIGQNDYATIFCCKF